MATHEITLDVTKKEITPQVIHTRVGDSNTTIKATVTNDGAAYSLSGATVKFKAAKPDGTYAEQSATVSGSTATVTLAPEFLAVPGIIKTAYFEITASGKKDTTGNVWIDNRADAEGEAPDLSTSYIPTVDQLVEDATEALNSANTALGNAEEALEDAEAATDSATDAAASANAAASAAQSAIDAMTGNVLRGTVGPSEVVSADDAYAQTPLGLTVYGSTRKNLWVNPSGTANGITVTENEYGSITLSGTATATAFFYRGAYVLKPSTQYTLSVDKALPGGVIVYIEHANDAGYLQIPGGSKNITFTTKAGLANCVFGISVISGSAVSGTYRVMLNEGSEAEPWCPPGLNSVGEVSAVLMGKNLWVNINKSAGGVTAKSNEDGSMTISGDVTNRTPMATFPHKVKPNTTYTISADKLLGTKADEGFYVQYIVNGALSGAVFMRNEKGTKFTTPSNVEEVSLGFAVYPGFNQGTYRVMLNEGETAEPWEAPNVNTVPIDLQGNELCSLPDGTRDALECVTGEAVKDTQKVVLDGTEDWKLYTNANLRRFGLQKIGLKRDSIYLCDKFPVINPSTNPQVALDLYFFTQEDYYVIVDKNSVFNSVDDFKSFLSSGNMTIIGKAYEKQTFQVAPPELPALPAPNLKAYADSDVPCDMEIEYARDVTLVVGSLEAKVAALELLHETE